MNWTCPYCLRPQTITTEKIHRNFTGVRVGGLADGSAGVSWTAIGCANDDCQKLELTVQVVRTEPSGSGTSRARPDFPPLFSRRIIPDSLARSQPDYIPTALREDYSEACLIRDLSPKASATLSRRCLQGMIRDFAGIVRRTLYQEVSDLKEAVLAGTAPRDVSIESVDAIDHVRAIGNIGAHMEADIEKIIPVEPDEAQLLIELIESLFAEWYVERHTRRVRFSELAALADAKKLVKATPLLLPPP